MMYESSNVVVNLESQLNLNSLIKWKNAEHIYYDYTRAIDDLNAVENKLIN